MLDMQPWIGDGGRVQSRLIPPRSRAIGRRILIACTSTLLTLVILEAVWRFVYTRGFGPTTNPRYVLHDDQLGWRYLPSVDVRHKTQEFDVGIQINSRGERDDEAAPEEKAQHGKLLLLGDSLAFGWGVEQADMLATRLEATLDREVRNLAVSGYGTDQELLKLRLEGLSQKPVAVIVVFCDNDVEEVLRDVMYGKRKPRFALAADGLELASVPGPQQFWERASYLYRSVRKQVLDAAQDPLSDDEVLAGKKLVLRLFTAMAEELQEESAALIIVHAGADWIEAGFARPGNAYVLDVLPALMAAEATGPVVFAHDPHWNARGHRAVAEAIAAFVKAKGLAR